MSRLVLAGLRILVVEDEYMIAEEVTISLQQAGATVLGPVPSVKAALTLLDSEHRVDGAVLDMNLSGETVFAVADLLAGRHVPFVFMSGYDAEAIPASYAHIVHVSKPYDPAKLAGVLAALLAA